MPCQNKSDEPGNLPAEAHRSPLETRLRIILCYLGTTMPLFHDMIYDMHINMWIVVIALPVVGFAAGKDVLCEGYPRAAKLLVFPGVVICAIYVLMLTVGGAQS